ncbi:hypothetical protein MMC31_000867 [Peltigera leucophlebia]|nr:hypothetical protein [Peltigera leucophlebia]
MRVISIYPRKLANSSDIEFESSHPRHQTHVQRHSTKPGSQADVKLIGPLFDSDGLSNIISADDPGTVEGHNDIVVILLALFVPWNRLHSLFADMGATNDNYSSFCWAIWCLCYPTLDDHGKYYAANVLQMRKSKIDACELAARNDHTGSSEEDVMEQADPLKPSNAEVDNVDEQFFEMGLETHATVESLVTLTIYNWRSADATDSLAFPAASHMWNSIRHADDNGGSSAFHRYLIQSNSDSSPIQGDMGLINNIDNETTTLWQTITKASASTAPDADTEVGNDVADTHDSVQLRPTQPGAEFLPTLSNDIQLLVESQQLDFIRRELGM